MSDEFEIKRERLGRLCRERELDGILLATQANFAWLTGGRSNRIDATRELGAGALLVACNGRVHLLANAIEMPRLAGEELTGLPLSPLEYPWTDDHSAPDTLVTLAQRALGSGARVGADWPFPGAEATDREIARARAPLTTAEAERYRRIGRDVARAVERMCRALRPGLDEREIARRVSDAAESAGSRAIVALVAADERMARYRHPVPTAARWTRTVLVACCAQREGLVVAITRIVSAGPIDRGLAEKTRATAGVFRALLEATRPGDSGAQMFRAAQTAYANAGYAGEERKHHQGGATGYRSREWVAHPLSRETAQVPQAFAWNPSITGTKIEDTALVTGDGVELITSTGEWPVIPITVHGRELSAADILEI